MTVPTIFELCKPREDVIAGTITEAGLRVARARPGTGAGLVRDLADAVAGDPGVISAVRALLTEPGGRRAGRKLESGDNACTLERR